MIAPERLVLIGHPVSHSLSPAMYDAALEAAGLPISYETLDVLPEDLPRVLRELSNQSIAGNFTIPHKRAAAGLMSQCSALARHAGAVNVFRRDADGWLIGDNTDVHGFNAMMSELLGEIPSGLRIAVLGAGGAAAAVLTAIEAWPGASASVHARDLARATAMRMRYSVVARVCSMRDPCLEIADIVVNATPIGMGSDELPAELERISSTATVVDLVYGPNETAWVRLARTSGRVATDGLPMLLHQGIAAYELWFDTSPDRPAMWSALTRGTNRN